MSSHRFFNKSSYLIILTILVFTLTACGSSEEVARTGQLELRITDAPVDTAEAVVIRVASATLHGPGGNTTFDVIDPNTNNIGRNIDLLQLQGGQWTGLFNNEVAAGHYSWIRLALDLNQSYIQINGAQHGLRCTSCENNGYRIVSSFDVEADAVLTLMLDFDVRKSITDPNGSMPEYILRPTVRLMEATASGSIAGTIDPSLITPVNGETNCSVYVFEGYDAQVDDIYIPVSQPVPANQNNPVSTAKVSNDGNNTYTASFLPAGNYSVSVTCDSVNDSAADNDILNFSNPQNVSVNAGSTAISDFPPASAP